MQHIRIIIIGITLLLLLYPTGVYAAVNDHAGHSAGMKMPADQEDDSKAASRVASPDQTDNQHGADHEAANNMAVGDSTKNKIVAGFIIFNSLVILAAFLNKKLSKKLTPIPPQIVKSGNS